MDFVFTRLYFERSSRRSRFGFGLCKQKSKDVVKVLLQAPSTRI